MVIPAKMKAAVLAGPGQLEIKAVKTPSPGQQDVLIKVNACAICSSDVNLIHKPWAHQPAYGSFIPGHEYAGTVVAVGETVDEFHPGDRVAVEAHLGCLRCRNCKLGNYTACLNYGNPDKGHRANGFTTNGGYAQYVANHINTVYKIPDSLEFKEAALVANLGCVLYGFETIGGYVVGDRIVVIGPGPLGLISVAVAKALCAEKVFLIGTGDSRLEAGKSLGADRVININNENPMDVVIDETGGSGPDLVIDSSGSGNGPQMAIEMVKRMGKILLLGFPDGPVNVNFSTLSKDNKSIYTVRGEGWANVGRGISMLECGHISLKPLVTHTYPLNKIKEGFKTFTQRIGGAIKVIVQPHDS